jgi:tRNA threonylcarbamoyladenosine biosynthesis protein TsaE
VLYHVDLYRLDTIEAELLENLEEHLFGEGVSAVEWSERLPAELRDGGIHIRFSFADDDGRRVELTTCDERLRRVVVAAQ